MHPYQPFPVLLARGLSTALVALTATTLLLCLLMVAGGLVDHAGLVLAFQGFAAAGACIIWMLVWRHTEPWS